MSLLPSCRPYSLSHSIAAAEAIVLPLPPSPPAALPILDAVVAGPDADKATLAALLRISPDVLSCCRLTFQHEDVSIDLTVAQRDCSGIDFPALRCADPSVIAERRGLASCGECFVYAVHTSGSSGQPKRVYVPLSCVQPNVADLRTRWSVGPSDCILAAAPPWFDPAAVDLLLALDSGARLVAMPDSLKVTHNPSASCRVSEEIYVAKEGIDAYDDVSHTQATKGLHDREIGNG